MLNTTIFKCIYYLLKGPIKSWYDIHTKSAKTVMAKIVRVCWRGRRYHIYEGKENDSNDYGKKSVFFLVCKLLFWKCPLHLKRQKLINKQIKGLVIVKTEGRRWNERPYLGSACHEVEIYPGTDSSLLHGITHIFAPRTSGLIKGSGGWKLLDHS